MSGLVAAWLLQREHEVTVFEARDRIGGHTNTVDVEVEGRGFAVDTGFIVHNRRTYPNLIRIFDELGVRTRPTTMSFSVREEATGIEYSSLSILARRKNALSPRMLRMMRDIVRFNTETRSVLAGTDDRITLGELLEAQRYSKPFIDLYIVPMGAAIWSTDARNMMFFPARSFIQFLENHGLTNFVDRPAWRVIEGGSREYVKRLIRPFVHRIRLESPVESITRRERDVELKARGRAPECFDRVVIATHSDQALRMLSDPSVAESEILSAMRYQENEAVLHTDVSLLPQRRRAWASWNYHVPATPRGRVTVTYDMNQLQGFREAPETFCVSLNAQDRIDPAKILYRTTYHHPLYSADSMVAQRRVDEISGVRNTYYCGAYWGYGFHEDGVVSALAVANKLGIGFRTASPDLRTEPEVAA